MRHAGRCQKRAAFPGQARKVTFCMHEREPGLGINVSSDLSLVILRELSNLASLEGKLEACLPQKLRVHINTNRQITPCLYTHHIRPATRPPTKPQTDEACMQLCRRSKVFSRA
eukprot:360874-Chlamydomonas_euryale.AAC.28